MRRLLAGRKSQKRADAPVPTGRRPNLLLLMTDQQRWDALGCSGGWVDTPNIDRIAAEGMRFPHAYTNAPLCIPARVSLAIGRYPHDHGVRSNEPHTLSPELPTWMRAIRDAGYATSVFGKTHLHPQSGDLREREHLVRAYGLDHVDEIAGPRASTRGRSNLIDLWQRAGVYGDYRRDMRDRFQNKPWVARPSPLPLELYTDVYVGRQAAAYLRSYEGPKPWFAWVSFAGPHEPWDAPEPYASRYDPAAMPAPVRPQDDAHPRPRGLLDRKLADGGVPFEDGDIAALRANYAGKVTLIDDQIGEVLNVVEERGEIDRTAIAFVSDHGEMNGDYGLLYKGNFLNPSARVPCVVRLPRDVEAPRGVVAADQMVELMDVGATLAELAGAPPVSGSFAKSLVGVARNPLREHRRAALSEVRGEAMLATTQYKLARNREDEVYLLFDLRSDPEETRNLAGMRDHRDIETALAHELKRAIRKAS